MSLTLRTIIAPFVPSPILLPLSRKPQSDRFSCFSAGNKPNKFSGINGSELGSSSDLATEVLQRIKTQSEERANALKKSKQLLFSELCQYLNSEPREIKSKWGEMNPDEKMGLVKGFVSDWGLNFHPLSVRSVRDLVDEFVIEDRVERESSDLASSNHGDSGSDSAVILPRLKNMIMGLSQNK